MSGVRSEGSAGPAAKRTHNDHIRVSRTITLPAHPGILRNAEKIAAWAVEEVFFGVVKAPLGAGAFEGEIERGGSS